MEKGLLSLNIVEIANKKDKEANLIKYMNERQGYTVYEMNNKYVIALYTPQSWQDPSAQQYSLPSGVYTFE